MHSLSLGGLFFAAVMYAISVSPSLLPRRGFWHGLVSGTLVAFGYTTGWLVQNLVTYLTGVADLHVEMAPWVSRWVPILFWVAFGIWFFRAVIKFYFSSREAARLVEMKPVGVGEYLLGLLLTAVIATTWLAILFVFVWLYGKVLNWLGQWLYQPLAILVAAGAVAFAAFFLGNRLVFRAILQLFSREAEKRNNRMASEVHQPQESERSGSAGSLSSWRSVGAHGRTFLGRGPRRADVVNLMGADEAMEPIRIYSGLVEGSKDYQGEVARVIEEMHRTGAFTRSSILISVATGSGWVDEWIVQPHEYLTRGDCATVSMQYSYLFSAAVQLTDREAPKRSTAALFEAVRAEIDKLPAHQRPRLFISGESLGAQAAQVPFADFSDMKEKVDGALLVGSPSGGKILRELTEARHRGSPEVCPVYDSAKNARFVNDPEQLDADLFGREYGEWDWPRIVFAQHASDPVVWYRPSVAFKEPDWLRERDGLDVSPDMRFTPLATVLQLVGDLPVAGTVPGGHGHTYNEGLIPIWVRLLGVHPPGAATIDAMGTAIRADVENSGLR